MPSWNATTRASSPPNVAIGDIVLPAAASVTGRTAVTDLYRYGPKGPVHILHTARNVGIGHMCTTASRFTSRSGFGLAAAAMASTVGVLAGCGAVPGPAAGGVFQPPPPLALVAIVDSSPAEGAGELRQLASVIQAGVTPSQALVVSLLAAAPAAHTYVVRTGDSLGAIAGAQGVSLAALQGANPQL